MHSVVLVEFGVLLDLAHHDDDGGDASEDLVAGALVVLPSIDEMVDALLEELSVNLDIRHPRDGVGGRHRNERRLPMERTSVSIQLRWEERRTLARERDGWIGRWVDGDGGMGWMARRPKAAAKNVR